MHYLLIVFSMFIPWLTQFIGATTAVVGASLGFGLLSFIGLGEIFDSVIAELNDSTSALPALVVTFIHLLRIDTAINIFLSSGLTLLVLKGMMSNGRHSITRRHVWGTPKKSGPDYGGPDWPGPPVP